MFDGMVQVITRPVPFFERLHQDGRLAAWAVGVVLVVSLLAAVVGYFSALPSAEVLRGSAFASIGLVTAPLFAAVFTFISWLGYGLVVRMTAGLEVKPWAVVGYSMTPQVLLYTLLIIIAALFPVDIATGVLDFSNPEAVQETARQVQAEVQRSVYGRSSQVVTYAATLWWLALIFLGVREASTTGKAALSAAVITLLSLGFILLPFLLAPVGG